MGDFNSEWLARKYTVDRFAHDSPLYVYDADAENLDNADVVNAYDTHIERNPNSIMALLRGGQYTRWGDSYCLALSLFAAL